MEFRWPPSEAFTPARPPARDNSYGLGPVFTYCLFDGCERGPAVCRRALKTVPDESRLSRLSGQARKQWGTREAKTTGHHGGLRARARAQTPLQAGVARAKQTPSPSLSVRRPLDSSATASLNCAPAPEQRLALAQTRHERVRPARKEIAEKRSLMGSIFHCSPKTPPVGSLWLSSGGGGGTIARSTFVCPCGVPSAAG